jgi:DNA-binding CsgD family transcriptional regulator
LLGTEPLTSSVQAATSVPFGFSAPESRQAERLYVAQHGNALDPAAATITLALAPRVVTVRRRRDLVHDEVWYRSDFVNVYRRPWRLDDSIYGAFGASDGRLVGFACFRAWGARPFTHQDIALARLFWEECAAQIAEHGESPLSRRQRETLRLLLKGDSAKAIASKLALSVHTVNEYIKTVYRVKRVHSRAELMARELTGLQTG